METMGGLTCKLCKYSLVEQFGYSNYTVTGEELNCLINKNPFAPIDTFYGETEGEQYANECSSYEEGDGIFFGPEDDEDEWWLTAEQKILLEKFRAGVDSDRLLC